MCKGVRVGGVFILGALLLILGVASGAGQIASGAILVSLAGENRVVSIDSTTGRQLASFPVPSGPHEISLGSDRRSAYVANPGAGPSAPPGQTVSVLDLRAGRVTNLSVAPQQQPHDVRISRDAGTLWVACAPGRAVLEMDARSGMVHRTWTTGVDGGWFVAVTHDESKIYVPHLEGKSVTAIDRKSGAVRTVLKGGQQSGIAMAPDGREAWVLDHEQRRINVFATASDALVARIDVPDAAFGRLAFTPDGKHLLLVQERKLTVMSVARRTAIVRIDMPLAGKVVSVSPDSRRAVISNPRDNAVTIVDLETNRVVGSFEVGKAPDGVAWVN
jgi:DNA-binding beta-propeller fold protein YncE